MVVNQKIFYDEENMIVKHQTVSLLALGQRKLRAKECSYKVPGV